MNEILRNRLIGAGVLIAVGILVPVGLVWWAQSGGSLGGDGVRVYKINEQGEAVPLGASAPAGGADTRGEPRPANQPEGSNARSRQLSGAAAAGSGAAAGPTTVDRPEPPTRDTAGRAASAQAQSAQGEQPTVGSKPEPPASADTRTPGGAGPDQGWVVQIGSFIKAGNARTLKNRVADEYPVRIVTASVSGSQYHRVRVGPYPSEQAAREAARQLAAAGYATQVQYVEP